MHGVTQLHVQRAHRAGGTGVDPHLHLHRLDAQQRLAFDLQRLLAAVPALPPEYGQVQLVQQFANTPPQILLQRGQAGDAAAAQTFATGNPYWKISFTPGPDLAQGSISPAMLGLAFLLALGGALIGMILVQGASGPVLVWSAASGAFLWKELARFV